MLTINQLKKVTRIWSPTTTQHSLHHTHTHGHWVLEIGAESLVHDAWSNWLYGTWITLSTHLFDTPF